MTLTPELKQAVEKAGDEPVRVEDPETHTAYLIVREDVYRRQWRPPAPAACDRGHWPRAGTPPMSKTKKATVKAPGLTFDDLVRSIRDVNSDLAAQAGRAVNLSVTLRNWLFGWHIEEYERRGVDRANTAKS